MKRNKPPNNPERVSLSTYSKKMSNLTVTTRGTINALPNKCLLMVLGKFYLQERILLRSVSRKWCRLIEKELKQSRESLKLFGSLDDVKYYCGRLTSVSSKADLNYWTLKESYGKSDDLIINGKYFNKETCDLLIRLFPNLQQLIICFSDISLFAELPYLLTHLSTESLLSLSICGSFNPKTEQSELIAKQICTSIDSMPSLLRLDLLYKNFLYFHQINNQFQNVFPRLARLSVNGTVEDDVLNDVYLTGQVFTTLSPQCSHFYLEFVHFDRKNLPKSVTHLTLNNFPMCNKIQNNFLSNYFDELQLHYLSISLPTACNFNDLYCLRKLPHLKELKIVNGKLSNFVLSHLVPFDNLKIVTLSHFTIDKVDLKRKTACVNFGCQLWSRLFPNMAQFSLHLTVNYYYYDQIKRHFFTHFGHLQIAKLSCYEDELQFAGRHFQSKGMINTLPNECLVMIFGRFYLQDLIPFRAVSTRWCQVIEEELARKRKSLKLFGSLDDVKYYCGRLPTMSSIADLDYWKLSKSYRENDDLIVSADLSGDMYDFLVRLFPNLECLIVCFSNNSLFVHLPRLLSQWSNNLVSLSICGSFDPKTAQSKAIFKQICSSIDSISSLKRLDLLYRNFLYFHQINDLFQNVFPKLTHLSINATVDDNILDDVCLTGQLFTRLSPACTHIYFESLKYFCDKSLPKTVTHLTMANRNLFSNTFGNGFLDGLSDHYEHLQYLCFNLDKKYGLSVIKHLSKLVHLTELRLADGIFAPTNASLLPLNNIKSLILHQWTIAPNIFMLFCDDILRLFPNLSQLTIIRVKPYPNHDIHCIRFRLPNLPSIEVLYEEDERQFVGRFMDQTMLIELT